MAAVKHTRIRDKEDLRTVNALMKEINLIEKECIGTTENGRFANSKLDKFQQNKQQFTETLLLLKQDIRTKNGIEKRVGVNAESIKLKSQIKSNLEKAKEFQTAMQTEHNIDSTNVDNGDNTDLSRTDIKQRQELVSLMEQDLQYTMTEFEPKQRTNATGYRLAQMGREKRRRLRDKELISSEPLPLTAKQQTFITESYERDAVLDGKLDIIKNGVVILGRLAMDVNEELDKQEIMLGEVEQKMDNLEEKIENRNGEIQRLLDQSGGAARWCPVMILCIVLMACMGYIYNTWVA